MSGAESRTEQATPKRMKKLRHDGSLQKSQDLSAWLGVGVAGLMLPMVVGSASDAGAEQLVMVGRVIANPEPALATAALSSGLGSVLLTVAPLLGATVLAAVAGSAAQGGIHIATKRLKPRFEQFNLAKGLKRLFSGQSVWQGVKAALKAGAIGMVLWSVVQGLVPMMLGSGAHSL
ncbi:MAG TPA: EscU/YscU/HrcU family type III secretion system export apparatus switch protein, partial [Actinotalea sp.]|nr:EscU/YscU/HrcU family type III secretion system export apparatus switch protein [Actinotalea sp.]